MTQPRAPDVTIRQVLQAQQALIESNSLSGVLKRMQAHGVQLHKVLDIGACRGTWTSSVQKLFSDAECVVRAVRCETSGLSSLVSQPNYHVCDVGS